MEKIKIWDIFLDILFPRYCAGCSRFGTDLCDDCFSGIRRLSQQECPGCRKPQDKGLFCSVVCRQDWELDQLLICTRYEKKGVIHNILERYKYQSNESFAQKLATLFIPLIADFHLANAVFVPMPLHPLREKDRGFNQISLILSAMRSSHDLQIVPLLTRTKNTSAQAQLSREKRLTNVADAFSLHPRFAQFFNDHTALHDRIFIVVDDVCTTGFTLNACASILRKAGAQHVIGLVLARGTL